MFCRSTFSRRFIHRYFIHRPFCSDVNVDQIDGPTDKMESEVHNFNSLGITYMEIKIERNGQTESEVNNFNLLGTTFMEIKIKCFIVPESNVYKI